VGVKNSSVEFLQYLDKKNIFLGAPIKVICSEKFDQSLTINLNLKTISISNKIAENLYIKLQ
jgi:DtxR family Mn-dependent transcriptional regulator